MAEQEWQEAVAEQEQSEGLGDGTCIHRGCNRRPLRNRVVCAACMSSYRRASILLSEADMSALNRALSDDD